MAPLYQFHHLASPTRRPLFFATIGMLIALVVVLSGCSGPTANAATLSGPSATSKLVLEEEKGYPIKVFFSKVPETDEDYSAVFPVNRVSPTIAVATFSIQLLIAGPTLSELDEGYYSELNSMLSGVSDCRGQWPIGPDFLISLDKRGDVAEKGTATLRFCRQIISAGTGMDARIISQIRATLTQFPTIKDVVILTKEGDCFGDMSGYNLCLN